MKFYQCKTCGNIAAIADGEKPELCCGAEMQELLPNTTDAAQEKHVPVISREGQTVTVTVGSVAHPMQDAHWIQWILLVTKNSEERKELKPGDEPTAQFYAAEDDEIVAAYAYCNLHGLWQS